MKYILSIALLSFIPVFASAATFHYVTSAGVTASVDASDAQTALQIAPNIAANSGVSIDRGLIEPGDVVQSVAGGNAAGGTRTGGSVDSNTYSYVTQSGFTAEVSAPNAQTALQIAPNIAANSGVGIDDGVIEPGMVVQSVAGN